MRCLNQGKETSELFRQEANPLKLENPACVLKPRSRLCGHWRSAGVCIRRSYFSFLLVTLTFFYLLYDLLLLFGFN